MPKGNGNKEWESLFSVGSMPLEGTGQQDPEGGNDYCGGTCSPVGGAER